MSSAQPVSNLTSGRLLARNTIWNVLGQLLPMAAAVVAIPPLVRALGVARFGVLTLAWVVIGYFSLFDLGIGRALTKLVADKLGANEEHSIPPLAWTSLLLMFLLGVIGGLVTLAISPWLVHRALKVPAELQTETLRGFYLLAVSIPTVTLTSGLRGILEAQQRFRLLNLIRVPMSVFSYGGPVLALPFSSSLVPVIGILVAGRVVGLLAHLAACFHAMPSLRHNLVLQRSIVGPVVKFGGWMTVSNIISPFMVYLDRFLIGALLSVSAVAYYTAPFDMVTRLTVIPMAVAGVLFPAFAVSLVQDPDRTALLLSRSIKFVFLATFPIVLTVMVLAPEGLRVWLGPAFAQNASSVLRWLAAGVFINCLAQLPFALIQGAGRPDITAKVHLTELPVYLAAVWLLTKRLGVEGTAIAWTARVTLDALLLFFFAHRLLPGRPKFLAKVGAATAAAGCFVYFGTLPLNLLPKLLFLALSLLVFGLVSWFWVVELSERDFLFRVAQGASGRARRLLSIFPLMVKLHNTKDNDPDKVVDLALNNPIIQANQVPAELRRFASIVAERQPKAILEVGTCRGGTLLVLCRLSHPDATVISVDLPGGPFGGGYSWFQIPILKAFPVNGQGLHLLRDDSHKTATRHKVTELLGDQKLDLLFIDADHTYEGVRSDFELYSPLVRPGGVIAFHDIAKNQPATEYGVSRLWNEIKGRYRYSEIIGDPDQVGSGLGLLYV
ncbi:MAG TPA: CmcI family methyltransferase [Candidatus Angelobacter sp.]|nr:CmcI family methyltransferase [Candidatus Angelobacter sp.]